MGPGRMEAFSDGVIAIIITVMVLELRKPHGDSFTDLRSTLPSLLAYVLSFVNLGIYWNNHHHLLRTVRRVNGAILWSNLNLLFWLSLFPFCTQWMAENSFHQDTVASYGVVLSLAAVSYTVLQFQIIAEQRPDTGLQDAIGKGTKEKLSLLSYVLSIPIAFVWRWGALGLFVLVAVSWFIPDRRLATYIESDAVRSRD